MAEIIPVISELVRAFDMQNIRILLPPPNPYNSVPQGTTPDAALYRSQLGTPVFANLKFSGAAYTDNLGNRLNFPDLIFDTVILTLDQTKNIVTTVIQGLDGTVKEYIGLGDYSINIHLIITGPNGQYPRAQVAQLRQMLLAPIPISVTSWYLQLFGINNLVVNSFSFAQEIGGYSYQPVSISALSDNYVQFTVS